MSSIDFNFHENENGFFFESDRFLACFGKKILTKEAIEEAYPQTQFAYIKQIHSDITVPVSLDSTTSVPADAHFTTAPLIAPMVQTADCIPVLVIGKNIALAIHSGWRGVEQNIIGKAISALSTDCEELLLFVGPHIAKESFEVGNDVAQRLLTSYKAAGGTELSRIQLSHSNPEKKYIDLTAIALQQLKDVGINNSNITLQLTDTVRDFSFHSYRREKSIGRQWSFCFLKNPT